ncbi:MAG: alanine racemase [Fusobacteria bacterium]|nr:alanine racemase [Fusobacteriota bacterium]
MSLSSRCSYVEIDIDCLYENYKFIKSKTDSDIRAVVKANAYGHGIKEIVYYLNKFGVNKFAVAFFEEAVIINEIVEKGEILILNYVDPNFIKTYLMKNKIDNFIFTVYSVDILKKYIEILGESIYKLKFEIKINTKMNRLGVSTSEDISYLNKYFSENNNLLNGVFSHFYNTNSKINTEEQYNYFLEICNKFNFYIPKKHISNSGGFFLDEKYHLDEVRIGMSLYGLQPYKEHIIEGLKEILSWKSVVSNILYVKKNENIGYGNINFADKDMKIAIVPIGYSDGYSYYYKDNYVLINNNKCKIIGEISMEQIIIDITNIDVSISDVVYLLGKNITIREISKKTKCVPDNITATINKEIIRLYKGDDTIWKKIK